MSATTTLPAAPRPAAAPATPRILLLGAGTVGAAFAGLLARRGGGRITQCLVRDAVRPRPGIPARLLRASADELDLDGVDVCVEALGGTEPALTVARRVLTAGIPYITANKTLVACHGEELAALARTNGTALRFEAAVGAAVPCVRVLRDGLRGAGLRRVYGVLNGTSHFILSQWLQPGGSFGSALREAQAGGLAEANPDADLSGDDAAQKLSILNWLVAGRLLHPSEVCRVGLPTLRHETLTALAASGFAVKPAACLAWHADGTPEAWVAPAAVPAGSLLAATRGPSAALVLDTVDAGPLVLAGAGAGGAATATALYDDLLDITEGVALDRVSRALVAPGAADAPKEWAAHLPPESGLRATDLPRLLRPTGGTLTRWQKLPDGGAVARIEGLPWSPGLTGPLTEAGACLLEVLR